ncbi:hypothetical protein [Streptomyces sp. NPDC058964]|uniref:hypothetical protein n=1 Tax=Streptomyces sp. NPDC058964 TaxID=3346681 RepID=UPI0036B3844A
MNDPGLPYPRTGSAPPYAPAAPAPPRPYRGVGLIPPTGPARTWGLAVAGLPLLLVLGLGLTGGLGDESGPAAVAGDTTGRWPGTPDRSDPSPTWPYSDPVTPGTASAVPGSVSAEGAEQPGDGGLGPSPDQGTPTGSAEPRAVVAAYFEAINNRDYRTAWNLGGKHFDADYDSYAAGYADTQRDTVTFVSVQGSDVRITLDALQTDGTTRSYDATYTVRDGEITGGKATPTS